MGFGSRQKTRSASWEFWPLNKIGDRSVDFPYIPALGAPVPN